MNPHIKHIFEPSSRGEQIDASIRFILKYHNESDAYYDSLLNRPNRLNAAAMILFMKGHCDGYHPFVIRSALAELDETGVIDINAQPYQIQTP